MSLFLTLLVVLAVLAVTMLVARPTEAAQLPADIPGVGRRNLASPATWTTLLLGVVAAFVAYWIGQAGALWVRQQTTRYATPGGTAKSDTTENGQRPLVMFQ